jgi:hypothetical protein
MNTSTPGGVTYALSKTEEMGSIGVVEKASKDGVEVDEELCVDGCDQSWRL